MFLPSAPCLSKEDAELEYKGLHVIGRGPAFFLVVSWVHEKIHLIYRRVTRVGALPSQLSTDSQCEFQHFTAE